MTVRTVAMLTAGGLARACPPPSEASSSATPRSRRTCGSSPTPTATPACSRASTSRSPPRCERGPPPPRFGGSPIGNSRVKLTNVADCVKRGLVQEGQDPLHVAAEQLTADGVDVLHTIGGDDTNTTAADLAAYLHENDYELTVVGPAQDRRQRHRADPPVPRRLDRGRAGLGLRQNIIAEHSSNPRMLIVHEVMGRHCGWLTAATAEAYHLWVAEQDFVPAIGNDPRRWDVHAVFVPERPIDLHAEADRLRRSWTRSAASTSSCPEGAGVSEVVAELEAAGQEVPRDPFGHVQLDKVNPGAWFAKQFAELLGAEKTMVQKIGYFSRSGRGQRPRPRAHQGVHRPRRRLGAARRAGRRRARRGARRRAAGHRVPPDQGRQGVRHLGALVRRPARVHRPGLTEGRPWSTPGGWRSGCTPCCSWGSGCGGPARGCRRSGPRPTTAGRSRTCSGCPSTCSTSSSGCRCSSRSSSHIRDLTPVPRPARSRTAGRRRRRPTALGDPSTQPRWACTVPCDGHGSSALGRAEGRMQLHHQSLYCGHRHGEPALQRIRWTADLRIQRPCPQGGARAGRGLDDGAAPGQ